MNAIQRLWKVRVTKIRLASRAEQSHTRNLRTCNLIFYCIFSSNKVTIPKQINFTKRYHARFSAKLRYSDRGQHVNIEWFYWRILQHFTRLKNITGYKERIYVTGGDTFQPIPIILVFVKVWLNNKRTENNIFYSQPKNILTKFMRVRSEINFALQKDMSVFIVAI